MCYFILQWYLQFHSDAMMEAAVLLSTLGKNCANHTELWQQQRQYVLSLSDPQNLQY